MQTDTRTPGQVAYETECWLRPDHHDGTPRRTWAEIGDAARGSWEKAPTVRPNGQRRQLRKMLTAGRTMAEVEDFARRGIIGREACRRFARLWAVSTATEHPYTARWSLDRWRARRARTCAAVRAFLALES